MDDQTLHFKRSYCSKLISYLAARSEAILNFAARSKNIPVQTNTESPHDCYRKPGIFTPFSKLVAAESTRHGGVSPAPYNTLNLGGATKDLPENVTENNRRFFTSLGVELNQVAKSHQIHGAEVLTVGQPGRYEGYDALITNVRNIQLAVTIADCTPILLFDPVKNVIAAIHAGWRGTTLKIARKTLFAMQQEFGTDPKNCFAYIGTCIDVCSFEVGEEVAEQFSADHKEWNDAKKKYYINLKTANRDQLTEAGVASSHIEISPYSTVIDNHDYFSYRKENGITGRMLATIGMLP
jgi:YfiH family protein